MLDKDTGDRIAYRMPRIDLSTMEIEGENSDTYNGLILGSRSYSVKFQLIPDNEGRVCHFTNIKNPREMSIDDIEKKLGYPIKIIK